MEILGALSCVRCSLFLFYIGTDLVALIPVIGVGPLIGNADHSLFSLFRVLKMGCSQFEKAAVSFLLYHLAWTRRPMVLRHSVDH